MVILSANLGYNCNLGYILASVSFKKRTRQKILPDRTQKINVLSNHEFERFLRHIKSPRLILFAKNTTTIYHMQPDLNDTKFNSTYVLILQLKKNSFGFKFDVILYVWSNLNTT